MRLARQPVIARIVAVWSLWLCSFLPSPARADVLASAQMLPDDVALMISVESVKDLEAALQKTSFWEFCKDPAVQRVVGPAGQKIRPQIDTALKDFWHRAKLENPPEQVPYPEGRVVFGLSLAAAPAPAPDQTKAEGEDKDEEPDIQVRLILLADMGSRTAVARQVVQALSAEIMGAGATMQKKELAGIEMDIRMPPKETGDPMICYGFKDNWLLVTVDDSCRLDYTESVARRVGRTLPESLADKPGWRDAARTLGEAQIHVFLNPDVLKTILTLRFKDKAMVERFVKSLGLANVTSLASAVRIAGDQGQELCVKTLVGIQGSPTGLPALLGPPSAPLRLNEHLLTRDALGFVCANYEFGKIFDDINKIVQQTAPLDLSMMVQAALMGTAGDAGQPPVQLRDDILAQIGTPLLVTWRAEKPYTATSRLQFLVALPVRQADRLETALGRVHKTFVGADPKLRRELLGHTLYLLHFGGQGPASEWAFAVAGDQLVLGPVEEVEQALRSLQKEPDHALTSDPTYRWARERLPSQAGAYFYRNDRLNGEYAWAVGREVIRRLADPPTQASGKNPAPNPAQEWLKTVAGSLDLSQWPDFKTVEKYWGTTVGFMQSRPEGIYCETTIFKPAPQ